MDYLRVKNWANFQHYKDRSPPWIKLHRELLTDYEFSSLTDALKGQLILIWILASQINNLIPYDSRWITQKIGASEEVDINTLVRLGFLYPADGEDEQSPNNWGNRYIPKPIKEAVWKRDKGRCLSCNTDKKLEFDHIIPISEGGESTLENIQLLCCSCNRKKRVTRKRYACAEQVATQNLEHAGTMRSLETETETETETEKHIVKTSCPIQEIVALYHQTLPTLPKCKKLTVARQASIRQRWREDITNLEDWKDYFTFISRSPFLMGKTTPTNGKNKPFMASLDWIVKAENYAKIYEGRYHG